MCCSLACDNRYILCFFLLLCFKVCRFFLFLSVPVICMKPQGIESLVQQFPPVLTAVLRRSNTCGLPRSAFPPHTLSSDPLWHLCLSLGWCFCVSDTAPGSARAAFLEYLFSTPGNSCSIKPARSLPLPYRWLIVTPGLNNARGRRETVGVRRNLSAANGSGCHLEVAKSAGSAVLRKVYQVCVTSHYFVQ